jgi:hypothetical protein
MKLRAAIVGALLAVLVGYRVGLEVEIHAVILALLGGLYIGFGVSDGRWGLVALESTVGFAFLILAFAAATGSALLVAIGYFAHGVWDVLHHPRAVPTRVAPWYPPLCAVYDWIFAAAFLLGSQL